MMNNENLLDDIRNVNLSYLLLVQRLLNEDRALAIFRLKISEQMADLLSALPVSQLAKLANSNQLICHFSLDDPKQLASLTGTPRDEDLQRTHAAILLAGNNHGDTHATKQALTKGKRRHG